MFSVFLLIIYRLTEYRIKQKLLRLQLIILIALLHVFTDIATTLNHGIYYTYIFTIFLIIFDKNKITSKNLIAGLLLFSIFRPTLLSILIFITVYLLKSNKDFGVLKIKLQKHMSDFYIFIPQYLILGILVISGAVYAHYDDKSRSSLSQNLSLWIKNIINIDHQAFTIIIIGLIFIIVQRKYYYLFLFISSFIVYCITAPRGNLSNPIYKAEILSPFLIIILVIIFSFISKLSIEFENYEKKKLAITQRYILILINLFVIYNFISSYNQIQFSNFSWDPKYESFSNERKISDKVYHFSQYASFGKVYYNKQALDIVTRQNCKFLDITYSGSMFLNTNISARNFINLARPLTIDATELNFSNEVKCVVVGNYPGKKFAEENEILRLNFTLIESFYQNDLKTYLKIYAR
jgi:hypothetical protein